MDLPMLSVVTPTYNSSKTLEKCLASIRDQDYPQEKIEIIIADGGSTDSTLEIAKKYTRKIFDNPLKTGEAGKEVGVKRATGNIIVLIDSDNILPDQDWMRRMVAPFEDPDIVGTEPLYYTYRKEDGYITRYCAMIGMNDPLCLFIGNYDRCCLITGRWTDLAVQQEDKGGYIKITIPEKEVPTIGANGFLIRKEMLEQCEIGDYLFDIDIIFELTQKGFRHYGKVKTGIIHIFSGTVSTFIRKQRRRINDYNYYKKINLRKYPWSSVTRKKLLLFVFFTLTGIPLLWQMLQGTEKKRDWAWLFHIPACWLTLLIYGAGTFQHYFTEVKPENRDQWR